MNNCMKFKAKPIQVNKVGESHSACSSIIPAKNLTTLEKDILETRTKIAIERITKEEGRKIVEAQIARQNRLAGYGERLN